MSGSNNEITNSAAPASSSAEPSMEEILASIRRILKEEQQPGNGPAPEPAPEEEDILLLDSSMVVATITPEAGQERAPEASLPEPEPASPPDIVPPEDGIAMAEAPAHLASEPAEPALPAVENATLELPASEAATFTADVAANQPEGEQRMSDGTEDSVQPPDGLMGDAASRAAASSIGSLIRSISSERSIAIGRPGLTLEDLVREELRPLLKSWLDSNLPALVERIVRAEIQRVVERTGA